MAYEITDDVLKDIKKHASRGLTKQQIADAMGWSRSTLHNKTKNNVDVLQAIKEGSAQGIEKVANALFTNATEHNNTTAQIFYLKNRAPDEWKDRVPEGLGNNQPAPQSIEVKIVGAAIADTDTAAS